MSNSNDGLNYLCGQFKNGIATGAGLTLFVSGIFIGHKVAVFVIGVTKDISNNSIHSFKQKIHDIIIEDEDENKNSIIY